MKNNKTISFGLREFARWEDNNNNNNNNNNTRTDGKFGGVYVVPSPIASEPIVIVIFFNVSRCETTMTASLGLIFFFFLKGDVC